jgi:multicomponent Na+:H+ antiporter subunit A
MYGATTQGFTFDSYFLTGAMVATNMFIGYAGLLVGLKPYLGPVKGAVENFHKPNWRLWMSPLILGLLGLILGIFPTLTNGFMARIATSIMGQRNNVQLSLWHGWNTVFILSLITIGGALIIYITRRVSNRELIILSTFEKISPGKLFFQFKDLFKKLATGYTNFMHNGYLRNYTLTIVLFMIGILSYKLYVGNNIYIDWDRIRTPTFYEVIIAAIMIGAIIVSSVTMSRLTALIALGVVGYAICILYVMYSAPDLAMTQFAIDTLTVVLFVLVLFKLPPFLNFTNTKVKIRDMIISGAFGTIIGLIALIVHNEPVQKEVSQFYAQNAYKLAKGKNVVNVILVDFRAMDTMFEIVVLAMASLGVYSLLRLRVKKSERE